MRRWPRPVSAAAVGAACASVLAGPAAPQPAKAPLPAPELARLTYVERKVEQGSAAAPWREAREGTPLRIGERIRTAADALARIDLRWMGITVSASSRLAFPDGYFLAAELEEGRVALRADGREILKVVTGEAEVRGRGEVVLRRREGTTFVSAIAGSFFVEGAGRAVALGAGAGTIVRAGQAPLAPVALPDPPDGLDPGADPLYVAPGESLSVRWNGNQPAYHVDVLAVGAEVVLIQREVETAHAALTIPWPGAFRWRVAGRDERGLEGRPSKDGLVCVDK
ncbi:MAG TPA: hypothetical protein VLI67_01745 [Vicinamibacteria bacterium]|nr:hypothetical protein [Vicinamibacteria bacterium]